MSLTKKDPSMRVAANDPHLVSLGGGRLSTAVTIHNIPVGDTTIGSSPACNISLNGSGVRATHCTIYRSEENEVTIVPETEARILIDGTKICQDTNLTQGAMITIGNSNYLRFNNPAEAQMIRSVMGSNERISMPQIDFTQVPQRNSIKSNLSSASYKNESSGGVLEIIDIDTFYESKINPLSNNGGEIITPIDINGLQCPKVFKADLVTVNLPAKDVLGQKYANFAKNLAENHRNEKNMRNTLRNNQMMNSSVTSLPPTSSPASRSVANGMSNFIQNSNGSGSNEYLAKVNNTSLLANDRYPKPGSYGGLQIFPMNGVNHEINGQQHQHQQQQQQHELLSENERLEDMLKKCTEYADRQQHQNQPQQQNQQQPQATQQNGINSSPIVQNRIKTNGSLPREKKSPFHATDGNTNAANQQQNQQRSISNSKATTTATVVTNSSGYENVYLLTQNRMEITEQQQLKNNHNNNINGNHHHHHNNSNCGNNTMTTTTTTISSNQRSNGYENVVVGKYVPQSPRTKIRTTCMSPKKEHNFNGSPFSINNRNSKTTTTTTTTTNTSSLAKQQEYAQLIRTFEQKLQLEMQAIEASSRYKPPVPPLKPSNNITKSATNTPIKRLNKNINNLSLNIQQKQQQQQQQKHESRSLENSPKLCRKPAPASRSGVLQQEKIPHYNNNNNLSSDSFDLDIKNLKETRKTLLRDQENLKRDINELQQHEGEALRELNMEKALVLAEITNLTESVADFDQRLQELKTKIHRLEAQRNATRVMEETQQAKLKQSIELKQEQVQKLKELLLQKPNNDCLKEELHNVSDSLENDRKTFEDLEFQYLEEESEWHAYREELHLEETDVSKQLTEKRQQLQQLSQEDGNNQCSESTDAHQLQSNMEQLLKELENCEQNLHDTQTKLSDISGNCQYEEQDGEEKSGNLPNVGGVGGMMSQSLFGSAEILCSKRIDGDIMSKSINENMFYNNSIEAPMGNATSTPKRATMKIMAIDHEHDNEENWSPSDRMKFNLSLGSDDFEVNPLEKRVPSQDDIDRICKVTSDAPISTKGASTKIFASIKEIERNRQLLLAQQGHHVIEHERQKMFELKKRCHDEARAQYLSQSSVNSDHNNTQQQQNNTKRGSLENSTELQKLNAKSAENSLVSGKNQLSETTTLTNNDNQRHSQPEFQADEQRANAHLLLPPNVHNNPRPLSATNSDLSCDILQTNNNNSSQLSYSQNCAANKSSLELNALALRQAAVLQRFSTERAQRHREQEEEAELEAERKRSSLNSTETTSAGSSGGGGGGGNGSSSSNSSAYVERKRTVLPKHQRPLTRYLPIFSPDLNLRHHIETAGHQITLCPHVFIDAFSCRGYLHKLGATFHTWARRWFVLDRQRSAFIYYADKSERKPRGGAYFSTIDEVYLDHLNASKSGRPHCTFIVKTKKRSYHLQAASDAAARIWIDAIITGAQGNIDY